MAYQVEELECPSCGAPIGIDTQVCPHCFRDIVVRTFHTIGSLTPKEANQRIKAYDKMLQQNPDYAEAYLSKAFCYLRLRLYDKALPCFDKAIEENLEEADAYFYAAVARLRGKRPFLTGKKEIEKIEEYLNAATMLEEKGIYAYFHAYLKNDYYEKKKLRSNPTSRELLEQAARMGFSQADKEELQQILGSEMPTGF